MKLSPAFILIGSSAANDVALREINDECDPQWKPASERCSNACEYKQIDCIIACDNEPECLSNCSRETVACLNQCPCHTECFDGCPCEGSGNEYCSAPVNLVLLKPYNIFGGEHKDYLWTWDGPERESSTEFNQSELAPYRSCSYMVQNRMFLAGSQVVNEEGSAKEDYRRHYELLPTGLQRLNDLEFDLADARCVGMDQYVGHSALLCGSEVCLVHDTEAGTILETGFPKNNHSGGAMAVYKRMEEIMFVGGDNDNTTEFYNPVADDWVLFGAEFPASSISRASAVSFHETVYLFGGIISDFGTEESNSVSIYEHDAWVIQEQSMRVPRDGHTSVVQGEFIIHIGGSGDKLNEIWQWKANDGHFDVFKSEFEATPCCWDFYPYAFPIDDTWWP